MPMKLCLEAVIRYQRRHEDGYVVRVVMPGSKRNHNFNDGMNQLLGMSNDWLVDVFSSEYKFASAPGTMDSYVVEDDELFVTLRRDRRVHKVDKFNWLCSCELSSTVPLPCRHSMLYRKLVCGLFMILFASISAKWLRYGNLNEDLVDVDVPIRISKADTATYLPTRKFEAAIINLEKGCQNLRQGDVTTPNSDSPNGESDIEVPPTQESNAGPTPDGKTDESNEPAIGDADGEEPAAAKPEISPFNPRAKRVGRPKKDKKAENQMRNQDRKEYTRNSK
ncbi:hypothetical protein PC110_g18963 [Phytophthora cactorum]|uniref:SWIM-type domain-containing protein n=1 Tax=Phytophthora cactorum TaxID=29920 RepID=A0A329RMR7_9STRA|nr:hypothetical protein PC114_g8800 [Phytophthora cactorum]KAG2945633.1 hypothetical protein PC117_g8276 [Phytophthora cactorum]KAG3163088.1 hypothetical protein C6341_g13072 [Phytophthora cactorum]RAW24612.1 hypothetical protein PC110_g18963 [Phytophthora cactorum]